MIQAHAQTIVPARKNSAPARNAKRLPKRIATAGHIAEPTMDVTR